jgi:hypothetical protein
MVNKALLEHQQIHRNRPVGTDILFGSRKKRFPQHGTRFEYQKKFKGSKSGKGIKTQRNQFIPLNPLNDFMRVGQPTDQLYANMFLANTRAIQDGRMLVGNTSVAPRTMKEFGTSTTLETQEEGTQSQERLYTEGDVRGYETQAFLAAMGVRSEGQVKKIGRRQFHTEMARGMRSGMGMETRGQPTLTPELTSLYSASFLRPTPERVEFTEI